MCCHKSCSTGAAFCVGRNTKRLSLRTIPQDGAAIRSFLLCMRVIRLLSIPARHPLRKLLPAGEAKRAIRSTVIARQSTDCRGNPFFFCMDIEQLFIQFHPPPFQCSFSSGKTESAIHGAHSNQCLFRNAFERHIPFSRKGKSTLKGRWVGLDKYRKQKREGKTLLFNLQ